MEHTIKYNNKEYPVKVGYYALKHTSAALGAKGKVLTMEALMADQDITILEVVLKHSLIMGCRLMGETMDIPDEEMEFILDDNFNDFVEWVGAAFNKEQAPAVDVQKEEGIKPTEPFEIKEAGEEKK